MTKLHYVCTHCDSDQILHDAWAVWNPDTGGFELANVFDNKFCGNCEATFNWLEPVPLKLSPVEGE